MKEKYQIPIKYKDATSLFFKNKLISKFQFNRKRFQALFEIIEDWNRCYDEVNNTFPNEVGEYLEEKFENSEYLLGIHRTDASIDQIQNIFSFGLQNRSTEYDSTVQTFRYFPLLLREIVYCNHYKNAQGCILVAIPKKQKLPIYYEKDGQYYLLPEYIYGYVPVKNEEVGNIILNPNYLEIHDYEKDGLLYDERIEIEKTIKK